MALEMVPLSVPKKAVKMASRAVELKERLMVYRLVAKSVASLVSGKGIWKGIDLAAGMAVQMEFRKDAM
jgi:hypothetical protein